MNRIFFLLFAINAIAPISRGACWQEDQRNTESAALESITFSKDSVEQTIRGQVVVQAKDGGVLLEDRSGTLWTVKADQLKAREATGGQFKLFSKEERIAALKPELGEGFSTLATKHYLIAYNTDPAYAEWCSELLERFYAGYFAYWKKLKLDLHEPDSLLTVIIFRNKDEFQAFYEADVGQKTQSSFGYYSIRRNRSVLYDFSGLEGDDRKKVASIKRAMKKVPFNLSTIVHEGTHQLAFNSGLHTRYADNPVWLTEGIAMLFEAPDFGSKKWTAIGRLTDWRKNTLSGKLTQLDANSLSQLTQSDDRFRSEETANHAYAEAWGLTLFLMNRRKKQFTEYIKAVGKKPPLIWDKPEERLKLFSDLIGEPEELQTPLQSYLKRRKI